MEIQLGSVLIKVAVNPLNKSILIVAVAPVGNMMGMLRLWSNDAARFKKGADVAVYAKDDEIAVKAVEDQLNGMLL